MTPLFALVLFGSLFWAGLAYFGLPFGMGVVWFGAVVAWAYWYAFGDVK